MSNPAADVSAGKDIYRRLQERIDELPAPFPATRSGVELRLLEALFDEREARIALSLSAVTEPVETIARRIGAVDRAELESVLAGLAKKGAINAGITRVGAKRVRTYGLAPLVVGMFEFQVDKLTPAFVRDFRQYLDEGFRSAVVGGRTAQMRTVPVRAEIASGRSVAPYHDIRGYLARHPGPFSVINCVCRQAAALIAEACTSSSTHETCLMIGHVPAHARRIDREELFSILDRAEAEGHVLQPQNSQKPVFICCCCRDCCEILRNARKLPRPADAVPSAYTAVVDEALCTGCHRCVARCPMEAISVTDRLARVDESRCIGCGLCATTCPVSAVTLPRRRRPRGTPRSSTGMYLGMYADRRGLLGAAAVAIRTALGLKV